MALRYKAKAKEEIPSEHQSLYTERDGAWYLDVDGVVEKQRVDELRRKVNALEKERDELKQRVAPEGAEPGPENEPGAKPNEADKAIERRLRQLKADLDKQLAAVAGERDTLNARLTAIQIDQAAIASATKRGLRPAAITDLTARARASFKLVNGIPAAIEGDSVRYGKDGINPMGIEEWVDTQVAEAPHLFEQNGGAGAPGATAPITIHNAPRNPFRKDQWSLKDQYTLMKSNPGLAKQLQAQALQNTTRNSQPCQ